MFVASGGGNFIIIIPVSLVGADWQVFCSGTKRNKLVSEEPDCKSDPNELTSAVNTQTWMEMETELWD